MARLIVGLGNPGLLYKKTRHNAGFMILEAFAKEIALKLKSERRFSGKIAKGEAYGESIILLKPATYMNLSGDAVQKSASYYKIRCEEILIITDDVALPLGTVRLRKGGSSGGHKGLESISKALGSMHYPRLRVGIGSQGQKTLEDYVLGRFTKDELHILDEVTAKCLMCISLWLKEGIDKAMNQVN